MYIETGSYFEFKIDYCPYVGRCIAFHNYKLFLLFLTYGMLYCWVVLFIFMRIIISAMADGNDHVLQNFNHAIQVALASLFGSLLTGLWIMHAYLLSRNITTIEFLKKKQTISIDGIQLIHNARRVYDLGYIENFKQVFGATNWLLPFPAKLYSVFI